ncbi:hypothetical protein PC116_g27983 [Phytophthora cactorum]|nr:hypothetical protein PC116_g27983 [Phytophthora cactorum]
MLPHLSLLALLPLAITATPISISINTTLAGAGAGATPTPGVMFKEIQVHCPNDAAQHAFQKCYDDNAPDNCDNKPGPDKKICEQLWQIWCGAGANCDISYA